MQSDNKVTERHKFRQYKTTPYCGVQIGIVTTQRCGYRADVEAHRHHKNCLVWTATTDGKKQSCDCRGNGKSVSQPTAPERIFMRGPNEPFRTTNRIYTTVRVDERDVEYVRSDIAIDRAVDIVKRIESETGKNYSHIIAAFTAEKGKG